MREIQRERESESKNINHEWRVKVERIRGGKDQVDCTVATVFFDDLKGDHVRGSVKQESCDDQNLPEYDFSDDEERFEGGVSDEYKDLVKSMISWSTILWK